MGSISKSTNRVVCEYSNHSNNGRERVERVGQRFFVSSDFGCGFRFRAEVDRKQVEAAMRYTGAPNNVVDAINSLDELVIEDRDDN
jgi:hypothetical protein